MTNEELAMKIKAGENVGQNMEQLHEQMKRFIRQVAWKYKQDDEFEDLLQEGFLALYDAVEGYDPAAGVTFLHYAAFYIRNRMNRYLENNGNCVRIPVHRQEDIRKYQRFCSSYYLKHGHEPSDRDAARYLMVSLDLIAEIRRSACLARVGSLDSPVKGKEGGEDSVVGDFVSDSSDPIGEVEERIEYEQLKATIWECVDGLPGKQPAVIRARYADGLTLKETGERIGTTGEGAREWERKALRELRKPSRANRLRPFLPEVERIRSRGMKGTGTRVFERTWTSATERVALKQCEV